MLDWARLHIPQAIREAKGSSRTQMLPPPQLFKEWWGTIRRTQSSLPSSEDSLPTIRDVAEGPKHFRKGKSKTPAVGSNPESYALELLTPQPDGSPCPGILKVWSRCRFHRQNGLANCAWLHHSTELLKQLELIARGAFDERLQVTLTTLNQYSSHGTLLARFRFLRPSR